MKKSIRIMSWLIILSMMLAACGTSGGNNESQTVETQTTEAADTAGSDAQTESTTAAELENGKKGGTLVMSCVAEPVTLNPNGNYEANGSWVFQNCFNRLIKLNSMQQVIPDLAESYEVSEDNLSYTFHLHQNVKFHDGEEMTSEDVKFSIEELIKQGGIAAASLSTIAGIECPDENTVVITTSTVDASLLYNIAYQGTFILPKHVYEGKDWLGADALQTPCGTGPFKFDSWDRGIKISLVRNDEYFLGPDLPYLDGILIVFNSDTTTAKNAFVAGEYDQLQGASTDDCAELSKMDGITLDVNMYPSRFVIFFNMNEAPFNDVNARKAVAHAINIDELMKLALKDVGVKAEHYLSPLFDWAVNKDVKLPEYDLAKSAEYMEKAGLTKDAEGFYLHLTLDSPNYAPFPDVAQVLKSELAEAGIAVDINMLEYASFDEKVVQNKNFSLALTSDYQGPEVSAIANTMSSTGLFNFGFASEEVDKLLTDATSVVKFEERAPFYQKLQTIMDENTTFCVFSEWVGYYPRWSYVKGVPASPEALAHTGYAEYTYVWLDK